jgi:hypothetical protein
VIDAKGENSLLKAKIAESECSSEQDQQKQLAESENSWCLQETTRGNPYGRNK